MSKEDDRMRNNRMRFVFYISILLGTIFTYLGSPYSPMLKDTNIPTATGLLLLPFTMYGLGFYGYALWVYLTRNNKVMNKQEKDWGYTNINDDPDNTKAWPAHHQRLHAKILNSGVDYSEASPYDREKVAADLARMEKEMAEVRLKCFGPPKGAWKAETVEERVARLTASGVHCEVVND